MATLKTHRKQQEYFWGPDLTLAREALGMSQEEFADKCGWSQRNQSKLELPGIHHLLDSKKKEVFKNIGIKIVTVHGCFDKYLFSHTSYV